MARRGLVAVVAWALTASAPLAQDLDERTRIEAAAHYRQGLELLAHEAFERAVPEFQAAIRLDPLMVEAHYALGQCFMSLKRYPEALKTYLACREAHRESASRRATSRLAEEQRRDDAVQQLRNAIRELQAQAARTPSTGRQSVINQRIVVLENQVRTLERLKWRDLDREETPAEISLALGSAYFRNGDLTSAEREYLAAVRAQPKLGEAHNNLAVVLMLTGRFDEAKREMKLAEKAGFQVSPRFKQDLEARLKGR